MSLWQEIRWWFRRLVVARLNGERKAAERYRKMHGLERD